MTTRDIKLGALYCTARQAMQIIGCASERFYANGDAWGLTRVKGKREMYLVSEVRNLAAVPSPGPHRTKSMLRPGASKLIEEFAKSVVAERD